MTWRFWIKWGQLGLELSILFEKVFASGIIFIIILKLLGVQLERILCIIVEDSVQECQACFNSGSQPSRRGSAEHFRMEHHLPFFSMNGGGGGFEMKYTMLQNLSPFCPLCSLAPPFPCSRWRGDGKIAHSPDTAVILMETKMLQIEKMVDNFALSSWCSSFWNRNTGNAMLCSFCQDLLIFKKNVNDFNAQRWNDTLNLCMYQTEEGDYSISNWYPTALWVITSFSIVFAIKSFKSGATFRGFKPSDRKRLEVPFIRH